MQFRSPNTLTPRDAVTTLLENFVCQQRYLPPGAHTLASLEDLPPPLQARARKVGPLSAWRAWTDEAKFWFVAARLCDPRRMLAGLLALEIFFFAGDGQPVAAGEWILCDDGNWALRSVIDSADLAWVGCTTAPYKLH